MDTSCSITFDMARDPSSGELLRSMTETKGKEIKGKETKGHIQTNRKSRPRNPSRTIRVLSSSLSVMPFRRSAARWSRSSPGSTERITQISPEFLRRLSGTSRAKKGRALFQARLLF
jgi:hypothetical protein